MPNQPKDTPKFSDQFTYAPTSDTIRCRGNYLVAVHINNRWMIDTDSALGDDFSCEVLRVIRNGTYLSGPVLTRDLNIMHHRVYGN